MNIVMCYTIGNKISWYSDIVRPVKWESPEAAIVEFERAATIAYHERVASFLFAGFEFEPSYHFYKDDKGKVIFDAPDFLTVDEWFARGE